MRNSTLAEEQETVKSPTGKRCKIIAPPDVSSTGKFFVALFIHQLINLVFSRLILGKAAPFPILGEEKEAIYPFTN